MNEWMWKKLNLLIEVDWSGRNDLKSTVNLEFNEEELRNEEEDYVMP